MMQPANSTDDSKMQGAFLFFVLPAVRVSLVVLLVYVTAVCQADALRPDELVGTTKKNWTEDIKKSAEQFELYESAEARSRYR